jgi:cellulose 1,4-beta-cellobiosidase
MYPQGHLFHKQAHAGRFDSRLALLFASFIFALLAPGAFAATVQHVTNPYANAVNYLNPDYTAEVQTAIAAQPAGSTLAKQMAVAATYPTAVWLDHIGAINGSTPTASSSISRLGLQGHINAALQQQADPTINPSGQPIVVELVIYDLPDRDCAALASNGELSIAGGDTIINSQGTPVTLTGTGLQEYENDYITPIANILQMEAGNPNIRFVLVVEDDSLPNMITNVGQSPNPAIQNCVNANAGVSAAPSLNGVYVQAIQFALNTFHQLPNVYNYLDVGHHGWLGWSNNEQPAVDFMTAVAKGTTGGLASVDGFITNTANYGPTTEPFMTSNEMIGGQPVHAATFYHFNPFIDEESYAADLDAKFIAAGFPSTLGFLIDTSRNGWGSPSRPTAASTSTVLDTFVNQSKIDLRTDMGQWCNQPNAGMGVAPTVNPGGFANLSAFVWIKPPGESDGNYPGSVFNGVTSTVGDPNCNPTHDNSLANGMPTNAVPNSPHAGTFWIPYYTMLIQNAFPAIPATTTPGFAVAATSTSVLQGASVTTSVTVSSINNFQGTVTLSASGLPTGVTASFSPTTVTGSAGSTLTLTAAGNAAVGPATVTITGTSGAVTSTSTLALTVVAKPDFTLTATSTTVTVAQGTTATTSISANFVGGLTGSVSLAATSMPGVSVNFAPSSVNAPGGTMTVSFFAQPGIANASGTITITGTNGQGTTAITHSIPITLNIGTGGGGGGGAFTLTPASTSLTVAAGSSATDVITIGSATNPVTLSASALPTGVTASFSPSPATGTTTLTVTAASTAAAAGPITLTITGTSGTTTATTTVAVTITAAGGGGGGGGGGGSCHIGYTITNQWNTGFQVSLSINNTSTTAINGWTLTWSFANGQTISQLWNGAETQSGANVTVKDLGYNAQIPAGGSYTAAGFTANWNGTTNNAPTAFSLNGVACN